MKQFNFLLLFSLTVLLANAQCLPQATIFDDFESYSAGSGQPLPTCWSSIDDPFAIGLRDDPSEAYSGNNNIYTYTFFSSNDVTYIISPELSTIDGNHFASFYAKSTETNATIEYGTMSDASDKTTFVPFGSPISLTNSYQSYVNPNITPNAGHKYFVFKLVSPSMHTSTRIDDFSWSAANLPCNNVSNIQVSDVTDNSALISWDSQANSSNYTIEYGLSGFVLGSGTSVVTTDTSIVLNTLTADEDYDFYIQNNCPTDSSGFSVVNSFSTLVPNLTPCDIATNIQITDIQEESATIIWSAMPNSVNYTIEYGESGFTIGSGIVELSNDTTIVLNGLTENTDYDFYIKTNCSLDSSNYSTVEQFTTLAFVVPCVSLDTLFDDFESYPVGGLPNCWSSAQTPFAIGVRDTPNEAYSGDNTLFIYSFFDQ